MNTKMPFTYTSRNEFQDKLIEWIGDVLYDILPEHDYEVRDEQIFTAFQIGDAFCENKVHLAEAGLGTGKTFAYLLAAIPYARHMGKPVVISCATSALQEQLATEGGDISKLSKLLGLDVDVRMAKDPRQYVCDVHAKESIDSFGDIPEDIQQWIQETKRGERFEIPSVSDSIWKQIAWHEGMNCDVCANRGYCKLVRAREHYRGAGDLIVVDHETFFHDLWTREERLERGQLPILPDYAGVVFDEGHKIMLPAAMQAGQQLVQEDIEGMIAALEDIQGAREDFYEATGALEDAMHAFFDKARESVMTTEAEGRLTVLVNEELWRAGQHLRGTFDQVLTELQIEQQLYLEEIPLSLIEAYEGQIEKATKGLAKLAKNKGQDVITWIDQSDESFFIVPRDLTTMLQKTLYTKQLPVVFSSATLSNEGNFDYFMRMTGIQSPSKSTIGSPFDMEEQVTISFESEGQEDGARMQKLIAHLQGNGGRALVLTRSLSEVARIRQQLKGQELPFEVLYEDQADRGYLVRRFKEDETSVLVSSTFWEGIDVPGDALTLVVIWQLPFPAADPLIEARRREAEEQGLNPVQTVDYPEMGLRLKQGCGRLIRTETDKGEIVFMDKVAGTPWEKTVRGALPKGANLND